MAQETPEVLGKKERKAATRAEVSSMQKEAEPRLKAISDETGKCPGRGAPD